MKKSTVDNIGWKEMSEDVSKLAEIVKQLLEHIKLNDQEYYFFRGKLKKIKEKNEND